MKTYTIVDAEPLQAKELVDAGWYVLDVRTDAEWAQGHLAGSHHVPLGEVVAGVGTRVPEPVLIVTEDGGKGWRVSRYLQQHGVEAANLVGGIFAWEAAGLPVER
jgi:rhodanese-related sulfurtransferase